MWLDYLPAISLAVVLAGFVQAGGGYISRQNDHDRRIEQLEKDAREETRARAVEAGERAEMLQKLDLRLARIEVKLEMMVPEKGNTP